MQRIVGVCARVRRTGVSPWMPLNTSMVGEIHRSAQQVAQFMQTLNQPAVYALGILKLFSTYPVREHGKLYRHEIRITTIYCACQEETSTVYCISEREILRSLLLGRGGGVVALAAVPLPFLWELL